MRRYILILALTLAGVSLNAQKMQEDAFARANAYYNNSQYDSALIVYNRIISDGYISTPLLYNMGNAYFKLRNVPMSIFYYERALKLDPNNEDVRNNLAIANALTTDKIEPLPVFFLTRWHRNVGNIFTADGWALLSIILFAALLLTIFLYLTARRKGLKKSMFFTGIFALLLFVVSIVFSVQKSRYMNSHDEAIITIPTITVKSSPSSSGVDLFVLHEGTKVEVKETDGSWDKIRMADGSVGWLPGDALIRF